MDMLKPQKYSFINRKLGEFSMILQSVVEDEPITIEERILDLNHNALLPVSTLANQNCSRLFLFLTKHLQ